MCTSKIKRSQTKNCCVNFSMHLQITISLGTILKRLSLKPKQIREFKVTDKKRNNFFFSFIITARRYLQLLLFEQQQRPRQILILVAQESLQHKQSLLSLEIVHMQLYLQQTTKKSKERRDYDDCKTKSPSIYNTSTTTGAKIVQANCRIINI